MCSMGGMPSIHWCGAKIASIGLNLNTAQELAKGLTMYCFGSARMQQTFAVLQKGKTMRPIDADALMEQPVWLCGGWVGDSYAEGYMDALDKVEKTVKLAPTIDAVPVVRCKDCKYWDKDTLRHNSNDVAEWDECECEMLANRDRWNEIDRYCCDIHFCADGERKDDEID